MLLSLEAALQLILMLLPHDLEATHDVYCGGPRLRLGLCAVVDQLNDGCRAVVLRAAECFDVSCDRKQASKQASKQAIKRASRQASRQEAAHSSLSLPRCGSASPAVQISHSTACIYAQG